MKTRNAFRSLCFAATLAALPGVAAIAADATARKSAATVGQALARALNERDAEAFMRNIDNSQWLADPALRIVETKGSDATRGAEFTLYANQRSQVPTEGEEAAKVAAK